MSAHSSKNKADSAVFLIDESIVDVEDDGNNSPSGHQQDVKAPDGCPAVREEPKTQSDHADDTAARQARNLPLDLLRVLSIYMVLQLHVGELYYIGGDGYVLPGDGPFWVGVVNSVCYTCVPLFVMISGFFLLPVKTDMPSFLAGRLRRIAVPWVFWCVCYAVWCAAQDWYPYKETYIHILHIPVNFGVEVGHLWYVYMLCGLMMFAPIISPFLASASRDGMLYYLLCWAVSLCLPYVHLLFPRVWGECVWNHTPLHYYFSGFLGYLVLGFFIKKHMPVVHAWHMYLAGVCVIVGYCITVVGWIVRLSKRRTWDELLPGSFESINIALMAGGIFVLFKGMRFSNPPRCITVVVSDMARMSFGMYLCHIMILERFHYWMDPVLGGSVVLKIVVIAVCTFLASYLVIKAISLVPYTRFITGCESKPASKGRELQYQKMDG